MKIKNTLCFIAPFLTPSSALAMDNYPAMKELGALLLTEEVQQSLETFDLAQKKHLLDKDRRILESSHNSPTHVHEQQRYPLNEFSHLSLVKQGLSDKELETIRQSVQNFSEKEVTAPVVIKLNRLEKLVTSQENQTSSPAKTAGLAATIAALGISSKLFRQTRQPNRIPPLLLAAPSILSAVKSQGTNIVVGASGLYLLYSLNKWIHAPCKAREKEVVAEFKKTVADANKEMQKHFETLQHEVLRQTEQARMNGVDAIVKVDQITQKLSARVESLEEKLAKTDLKKELAPLKEQIEQQGKSFKKELIDQQKKLDEIRKQKDQRVVALHKELDTLQKQLRDALKSGSANGAPNDAIAILALKLQQVSEDLKRHESTTPASSQASSPAATPRGSYASGSLPRDFNIHNVALIVPEAPVNKGRRASVSGPVPPLSPVTEGSSSPELNDSMTSVVSQVAGNPQITVKPPSPQRRHSICGGLFGHKDENDKGKGKEAAKPA